MPRDTWGVPLSTQSVERLEKMLNLRKLRYLEGTIGEVQISSHCCDDETPAVEESAYAKARTALLKAIDGYTRVSIRGDLAAISGTAIQVETRLADLEAEVDAAAYKEGRAAGELETLEEHARRCPGC